MRRRFSELASAHSRSTRTGGRYQQYWSRRNARSRSCSPGKQPDGKPHRYFVDFKIHTVNNKTYLVEIKPSSQTIPPKGTRKTKRYLEEAATYLVNQAKWDSAKRFAKARNWEFMVITEKELGL